MIDDIIAYENGELDYEDTIALFQHLVDTGAQLIEVGLVTR